MDRFLLENGLNPLKRVLPTRIAQAYKNDSRMGARGKLADVLGFVTTQTLEQFDERTLPMTRPLPPAVPSATMSA
jgi:hypothetical protein